MSGRFESIDTLRMREFAESGEAHIVDVRPPEAYNGWRLSDEPRGGHIRGARSLPARWASYIDWIEIVRSKGILPGRRLVLYGYDQEETAKVAGRFEEAGYPGPLVYNGFVDGWSADPSLPMQRLRNYRHLVPAEWLAGALEKGEGPEHDGGRVVLCHCHYRNPADYDEGHIPHAIPLDTNILESPKTWNRRDPEELREALGGLGIDRDTTVVVYGRFSSPRGEDPFPGSSAGHLGAMRCAFIMMYAGVKDVRVLNGGIHSWIEQGYGLTGTEYPPRPVDFGGTVPGRPELAVDTPEAKEILASPGANLVSVRSRLEFTGEVSGYNYIEKKGRIPGAVFGNCGSDAYHMENYRNLDHTTREYHEIERLWAEAGITSEKRNAFYCGTGWRASEAFFNAFLIGWDGISVYDGGWYEWSGDPSNPTETGDPGDRGII